MCGGIYCRFWHASWTTWSSSTKRCDRHLNCVALACRCNLSLFSDVGPLETIAENKKEQKSAAKRRQRLLKAAQQPPRMCVFPQRGAYSWWTWPTIPWKPWKFAEKHGQRIAYSWFNSIKNPTKKIFLRMCKMGQHIAPRWANLALRWGPRWANIVPRWANIALRWAHVALS